MLALVDGNNFYASCERVFRPALAGRPLIVLSNNDGCAIARSNEAKALGVKMGQPWFEIRHLERDAGLVALSANFTLYGDMSDRLMAVLGEFAPDQEVYSIDECFLKLDGLREDRVLLGQRMRERTLRWIGIPTCVGIGPTKTLAKLANHIAKTTERKPGSYPAHLAQVCDLASLAAPDFEAVLQATAVGEVWGVGPRIGKQLAAAGIETVLQLRSLPPATVRARFGVVLERTVRELQGLPCIELDTQPQPKQQIMVSRSFGRPVTEIGGLIEAVSEFATRAGEKLRRQDGEAGQVHVFIHTSPFRPGPQITRTITVPLVRPSCDSTLLAGAAVAGIKSIFVPGYKYAKAGVMLLDLNEGKARQAELALDPPETGRDMGSLMKAMDRINARYGRGTLAVGSAGTAGRARAFEMRQERRTPSYTTDWEQVPLVRA